VEQVVDSLNKNVCKDHLSETSGQDLAQHSADNGSAPKQGKHTNSCPPGRTRLVLSSPWNLEWLHDHNHAEIICSTKKKRKTHTNDNVGNHSTRRKASDLP